MTIVSKALDSYVNAMTPTFTDRSSTVGASEIGQCARKTYWIKNEGDKKHAAKRDPGYVDTWGARQRGNVYERAFWYPAMHARFGSRLLYAGRHQKTFTHNYLSATPDGLVIRLTNQEKQEIGTDAPCVMVECKTVDPRSNLTEAKAENVYQTQVQMGIVRHKTRYAPTHDVLSYTDASFWSDVKEFVIEFDPEIYAAAQDRAAEIMTAKSADAMAPEGWIAGGRECNYCPFTIACGIERRNLPFADERAPVDKQVVAEFTDMALELKAAKADSEASDSKVRELQDSIRARLREKNLRKIPGVLSWIPVKGRAGYDNKAIIEAARAKGVDIEQFATIGEPTDRLTILLGE